MDSRNLWNCTRVFAGLVVIFTLQSAWGYTYEQDVYAINNLYVALGSPPLLGWIPNGGDPCFEVWQGVQCVISDITAIILNDANLGGQLGDKLGNFTSIITIDLSNNHIGGTIPDNLPVTMRGFFLSANNFTGSIPTSFSELSLLSDMSLNDNLLTGELPDAFQFLNSLTNLHVQNNQLSGTLDVLQNLPLIDLNIENNLFSGPVPEKLLNIPNFKKDGNPFNTTIAPSPQLPPSPLSGAPVPGDTSPNPSSGPSIQDGPPRGKAMNLSIVKIVGCAFAAVFSVIILVLVIIFIAKWCTSKQRQRKSNHNVIAKGQERGAFMRPKVEPKRSDLIMPNMKLPNDEVMKVPMDTAEKRREKCGIDRMGAVLMPFPVEKVIVNPIVPIGINRMQRLEILNPPSSMTSFSVASLQQYTSSFSEENLIRVGKMGKYYFAGLPDGKLLVVMKLDNMNLMPLVDGFFELVSRFSELRHPNIVELVGYCAEYGQHLLVYNYFSKRTLHDVLHGGDDLKSKLSWNVRIQIALGAARALEYLHEGCQPPVVHQSFEPASILLDDELAARVCDCGLASLMSSDSLTQLSDRVQLLFSYEAPEVSEFGYTDRSDVYSFGVVMLELLTGREPYDSSRPRAEQYLVRWASSQLHDINTLSTMVDPSMNGRYPVKSLSRFVDIISRCIQQGPEFRPPMSEVVQDLTRMVEAVDERRDM